MTEGGHAAFNDCSETSPPLLYLVKNERSLRQPFSKEPYMQDTGLKV